MTKEFFINQYCRFEAPVTRMLSLLPDERLEWSPVENTMTTRAVAQHVIEFVPAMAASLVSGEWSPRPPDLDGGSGKTKQQLLDQIKAAFAEARTTLGQMTQEQFETSHSKVEVGEVKFEGTAEEMGVSLCLIHMANHVMQLFWYLRQSGVDADTGVLYFGMEPGRFSTRGQLTGASA